MKILVVRPGPQFSVEDVANGWVKGLKQCGHEIYDWDLGLRLEFFQQGFTAIGSDDKTFTMEDVAINATAMLEAACWEQQPDIILIITGYYLPPVFYDMARRQSKVILMVTESPYEDDRHLKMAEHCDAVIINDTKNLEAFNEICPTFYYGHGYDPDLHTPGFATPDLISEFCFVGTGFPERVAFLEKIDWTTINATFAGNWQALEENSPLKPLVAHDIKDCIDNKDAVKIYQSSLISANLYRKQHTYSYDGHSCGPREIEMAACGLFFLRETRPESDTLFPMLPTFSNPKELQDGIHYWLNRPEERQNRADQALQAIADRSFDILAESFTNDLKTL